ncbi:hypothetical protein AAD001_14615 [Colwelliaceae bacterium 6471]
MNALKLSIFCLINAISFSIWAKPCEEAQYQQFDFWLGQWQVSSKTSKGISQSKITKINDGCGILEEYSTPSGFKGKSLNIYDKLDQKWHQTWVDNTGMLLKLSGTLINGEMVLEGVTYDKDHNAIVNRITWHKNPDNSVRQHWQISADQGKNWQTIFDGHYSLK